MMPKRRLTIWAGRCPWAAPLKGIHGAVYRLGIIWRPLPESEQVEGELIKARFAAELHIELPLFTWLERAFFSDWDSHHSYLWTGRTRHNFRLVRPLRFSFRRCS